MAFSSCTDDEPILPAPTPTDETPREVGRSVLVYMMADNSLGRDGYDRENLADMIAAVRDGLVNDARIIIYHDDAKADHPMLKEVTANGLRIIKEYDNALRSVTRERFSQVVADFKAIAPANRYGLVIWSHATGWLETGEREVSLGFTGDNGVTPLWVGEDRGHYMNVTSLAQVLEGEGFDYIYFDCCHMASVESLYELRHCADKFVASAAELPAEGTRYYEALPLLTAQTPNLERAAKVTFDYYNSLSGSARTCTFSVIDARRLDTLAAATRAIYDMHPEAPATYFPQPFERQKSNGSPCYLFDFADYIDALEVEDPADADTLQTLKAQWHRALDEAVTYAASTPWIFNRLKIDHHCGLSTYILFNSQYADDGGYRMLQWYDDVASHLFTAS